MDPILLDAIEYNGRGINTLLNRGAFKTVQRGTVRRQFNSQEIFTVPISPVNIEKSVPITDTMGSNNYGMGIGISVNLSDDEISFKEEKRDATSNPTINWTVIEFY